MAGIISEHEHEHFATMLGQLQPLPPARPRLLNPGLPGHRACVVAHSYGTLVASRLVKRFPSRLHSLCLVDPVCYAM